MLIKLFAFFLTGIFQHVTKFLLFNAKNLEANLSASPCEQSSWCELKSNYTFSKHLTEYLSLKCLFHVANNCVGYEQGNPNQLTCLLHKSSLSVCGKMFTVTANVGSIFEHHSLSALSSSREFSYINAYYRAQ